MKKSIVSAAAISPLLFLPSTISQVPVKARQTLPNILIIMVDDMGYSDPGCYGGEIRTPNIDYLADHGIRFTDFHNCARCSPTRASLLTGVYQHQAGMSNIGYNLTRNVVTLAEVLKQGGYQTGMTGKWHLSETRGLDDPEETLKWVGHLTDHGNFAPPETYPCNRGFDEHFGVIWGVVNHFDPFSLVHNETPIREVPEGFYLTDFITGKSVELIDRFTKRKKPFFLYVAHTAPHWPLHAPEEDIARYRGKYDDGWDSLRVRRYRKMTGNGLFDRKTTPLAVNESHLDWATYPNKTWESRQMEVHAAMVDRVDQGIGRIIAKLRETGQLDNTLIIFLSDNGASAERKGKKPGLHRSKYLRNGELIHYITTEKDTIPPGPQNTWAFIGEAWAGAINSPFRFWKMESYEGGTATPLIMHWPKGIKKAPGSIVREFGHVMDIMPTALEITGLTYPEVYNGHKITPYSGKSLVPLMNGRIRGPYPVVYWEHIGGKAIRDGNWKMSALKGKPWELFNLAVDRTETTDLSAKYPDRIREMEKQWNSWFDEMNLYLNGTKKY